MTLKTRNVLVNYNPTTKEMTGVHPFERELSREEVEKLCEELNPTDLKFVRCRVGVLVVDES